MNETKTERGLQVAANFATVLSCLRGLAYVAMVVSLPVVACQALPLLERAVVVLEDLDDRVGRAFEAAAPIGREAIEAGVDVLRSVDAEQLGADVTDAIQRKLREDK